MVLLLGGGGGAEDERPVLDRFLELAGADPIAYWATALDLADPSSATAFAEAALGRPVQTWNRLTEHRADELSSFGGVFIGGGNTFHLLDQVRRAGMGDALRAVAADQVLYGGSAGAILMGTDIGIAGRFDPNDVGLTDTRGLGLLGDHAAWCHYEDAHLGDLRGWARSSGHPVIALTERSGAEVTGSTLSSIGRAPLVVVDPDGVATEVGVGRSHPLGR